MRRIASAQDIVERFARIESELADAAELDELFEDDDQAGTELDRLIARAESDLVALEERGMFCSPEDARSAILSIHPGAGGTESCDWVGMLYRMYTHYLERRELKYRVLDIQPNEEAGFKDVTLEVTGANAYGLLKSEAGVHRLVRTSPFDANGRRHTTFAAVAVYPEVEEVEVEINPNDLRIDTFRAGGHGGQNVNKVSSAVRITHTPTGLVVVCQNERSQLQNKQNALKILRARIHSRLRSEQDEQLRHLEEAKTDIAWGHQIRSYVLFPYQLVKDHRTDVETHDVDGVLAGAIEPFVHAFLTRPAKTGLDTAAKSAKKGSAGTGPE